MNHVQVLRGGRNELRVRSHSETMSQVCTHTCCVLSCPPGHLLFNESPQFIPRSCVALSIALHTGSVVWPELYEAAVSVQLGYLAV